MSSSLWKHWFGLGDLTAIFTHKIQSIAKFKIKEAAKEKYMFSSY